MIATTSSPMAPSTKTPTTAGLIRLPMPWGLPAPREELAHARVRRVGQQLPRRTHRADRVRRRVEEHAVVADREDARQLVRDDDDGRPEAVTQLDDQLVEPPRGDRVEPGR